MSWINNIHVPISSNDHQHAQPQSRERLIKNPEYQNQTNLLTASFGDDVPSIVKIFSHLFVHNYHLIFKEKERFLTLNSNQKASFLSLTTPRRKEANHSVTLVSKSLLALLRGLTKKKSTNLPGKETITTYLVEDVPAVQPCGKVGLDDL